MKLMFVDESKKQGRGNTKKSFVLAGVVIDSENLIKIESLLESLKERYGIVKLKDIRTKKIPKQEARSGCAAELREILSGNGCYVISAVYGKTALNKFKKIEEVYLPCFKLLLERFFINLGMDDKGIIFHDEFGKPYGQKFIKDSYNVIKNEEFSCPVYKTRPFKERIHSQIFFGKDDYSNMFQVADVIVSALNKSYIKLESKLEKLHLKVKDNVLMLKEKDEYLEIYWDLFRKDGGRPVWIWD